MRTLETLPVFDNQSRPAFDAANWRLIVDGAVRRPLGLTHQDLLAFPRVGITADFRCCDGLVVAGLLWEGVRLPPLLARAQVLPSARFVTFHGGEYTIVLSLAEARHTGVLLATHLNRAPLVDEHGAPLRLVVPSTWDCFANVKWLQRIELTERRAKATGPSIALARLGQRRLTG